MEYLNQLSSMGNDDRSFFIDGKNSYGLHLFQDQPNYITWGSCTSSSWTEQKAKDAEYFNSLLPQIGARQCSLAIQAQLKKIFIPDIKVDIALTSSGTDVEYVPLMMVGGEKIVILPGVSEVGSHTKLACSGATYGKAFPFGDESKIEGQWQVDAFDVKQDDGQLRPDLYSMLKQKIESYLNSTKADIILHCVASSKSGACFPSFEEAIALKEMAAERIHLVMDACQGRFDRKSLENWITSQFCVLISGSKFFEGPTFCGAVFIPNGWGNQKRQSVEASRAFLSKIDLPDSLQAYGGNDDINAGLLCRWWVTLQNIERSTPETFSKTRRTQYSDTARNYLDKIFPTTMEQDPTIISFSIKANASYEELDLFHRKMSDQLFLGRPIRVGKKNYLRLALGISDLDLSEDAFKDKLLKTIERLKCN